MDKDLFKAVLRDRGIPVAANITLRPGDAVENPFGYPVFVKPARLGSSVGISKVRTESELEAAVALARRHDDKVLVEEFQPGIEVEVGVLGNRDPIASVVGRDRRPRRLVRLRREVRRRRHGADRARPVCRATPERGAAARRRSRSSRPTARAWRASTSSCARTARSSSTSSTRSPASPRRASTRSSSPRAGSRTPELLDRLVALALERHERRARARVLEARGLRAEDARRARPPRRRAPRRAPASSIVSGQSTRMQLPAMPALSRISPRSSAASITARGELGAGSFEAGSWTSSIASIAPSPRTSPIRGQRSCQASIRSRIVLADRVRARDEVLLGEDVEDGERRGERDRVADERAADRRRCAAHP